MQEALVKARLESNNFKDFAGEEPDEGVDDIPWCEAKDLQAKKVADELPWLIWYCALLSHI